MEQNIARIHETQKLNTATMIILKSQREVIKIQEAA